MRLFVQLTLERHDFDKWSVVGMTEKRKLKFTVSTLDRFHDESEYRLRIPARYIVDSEGVTPGREVNADYTIRPDLELNWIIENGIRFTGMPGFDKVETPSILGPRELCAYLPSTK